MYILRSSIFDPNRMYRYRLDRVWNPELPKLTWVMLNPSIASEIQDDATVRRCMNLARRQRYGGIYVVNLFAFVSTDPKQLLTARDPVGPENDVYIRAAIDLSMLVIAAWGANGILRKPIGIQRLKLVQKLMHKQIYKVRTVGVTREGMPRHPGRVRADVPFQSYKDAIV